MNKKLYLLAAACCIVFSCEKELPMAEEEVVFTPSPVTGSIEQMAPQTKVYLDENRNIRWSEGDEVMFFQGSTLGQRFCVNEQSVGQTSAIFNFVSSTVPVGSIGGGTPLQHNVAFYPFMDFIHCEQIYDEENNNVPAYMLTNVEFSSYQMYEPGTFGPRANAMVAVSSSTDLLFYNLNGGVKLQISGTGSIIKVVFKGRNGEKLAGKASVKAYVDGTAPEITFSEDASESIEIGFGQVPLVLNQEQRTDIFFSIPPTEFTKGFLITVYDTNGGSTTFGTSRASSVDRSLIMDLGEVIYTEAASLVGNNGTANCYIVSAPGRYVFPAVKGNSYDTVSDLSHADGAVAYVSVLWESFGTNITPNKGDLINYVSYNEDGFISFEASDKKGNAVIAARAANGKILWSWHIWLTDQPAEQVYFNNAGTMMDRNLGATSATPGEGSAFGLLYQWGRKDPFRGSYHIQHTNHHATTGTWPSQVVSDATTGTIAYAQANPMTFITFNDLNGDWLYSGTADSDTTRWESIKTIYDPCPPGWRVPEGGENGVWAKASGQWWYEGSTTGDPTLFNTTNFGVDFSGIFGSDNTIWYPVTAQRMRGGYTVGENCGYWAVNPSPYLDGNHASALFLNKTGYINNISTEAKGYGQSVRCMKEYSNIPEN